MYKNRKTITSVYLAGFIAILLTFSSCKKWLDVKPEDQTLREDVFKSELKLNNAMNGVYSALASPNLYGGALTSTTVDVMAQYYGVDWVYDFDPAYSQTRSFSYASTEISQQFTNIWQSAYTTILNINDLLDGAAVYTSPLNLSKDSLFKGELYGLRAMLHFDLLRLFGPIYNTADSTALSIPYRENNKGKIQKLLPANEVMNKVLADIATAETYLVSDPVRATGKKDQALVSLTEDFYSDYRNFRLNLYAVKALKARILLYRNDKAGAANAAREVIEKASTAFPWHDGLTITQAANPDRIFYSEVLFGNYQPFQSRIYDVNFSSNAPARRILAPKSNPDKLAMVFSSPGDFRLTAWWQVAPPSTTGEPLFYNKIFVKYKPTVAAAQLPKWANVLPLLRISEMYLILAEVENNLEYLNTVRHYRNTPVLSAGTDITGTYSQLMMEYWREFWGEGQFFFYYKRKNIATIYNTSGTALAMGKSQYVVPLPQGEALFQ